jgi:hypothetical protein
MSDACGNVDNDLDIERNTFNDSSLRGNQRRQDRSVGMLYIDFFQNICAVLRKKTVSPIG